MSADWEMSESVVSADAMQVIDIVKACLADPVWVTDVSGAWSSTAIDHVSRDYRVKRMLRSFRSEEVLLMFVRNAISTM